MVQPTEAVMRTVMMIAFLFPPSFSIGAKRPLRFARRLPAHGWRPLVFTAPLGTPSERDDTLLDALPPGLRVVRDYAPAWMWAVRNLGDTVDRRLRPHTGARFDSGAAAGTAGRLAGYLEHLAERLVPLDSVVAFLPHALAEASRLIAAERPDAIYVSAYPCSALVLGALLKRRHGVPLVGELRDLETMRMALHAAETGLLVFGTLHTTSAAKTVDRVIEVFPSSEQMQIRSTLADGIRAVLAQVLFKRADRKGRVAALEILIATPAVRNLIRENKTYQIASAVQTGKKYGMQLLDDAIMELVHKGKIDVEDAYLKANDKARFRPLLKSPPSDFTEA